MHSLKLLSFFYILLLHFCFLFCVKYENLEKFNCLTSVEFSKSLEYKNVFLVIFCFSKKLSNEEKHKKQRLVALVVDLYLSRFLLNTMFIHNIYIHILVYIKFIYFLDVLLIIIIILL